MILRSLAQALRRQDWETTTVQTVGQLRQFAEQLDRHLAAQVGDGAH
jgi:hypothetical protein